MRSSSGSSDPPETALPIPWDDYVPCAFSPPTKSIVVFATLAVRGHTLGPVIADLEKLTGVTVRRIHGDKGYRVHNYPNRFKVWISGQVRRVTKAIRREMRRRAAIEPVIGHLKQDHRMGRNYLTGRDGDRINAVLAAAGYNFSLLLRWFE